MNFECWRLFVRGGAAHLSVVPAHFAPPLQTGLQADGTPRQEVFTLHTQVAASVSDLHRKTEVDTLLMIPIP